MLGIVKATYNFEDAFDLLFLALLLLLGLSLLVVHEKHLRLSTPLRVKAYDV